MTPSSDGAKALGWLSTGILFLGCFSALFRFFPEYYRTNEPFHISPIALRGTTIPIRNDPMGEGHFGASRSNKRIHQGIDIAAPVGESIYASKSGRVSYTGLKGGYGYFVEVKHPDGSESRYGHLSEIRAYLGEWVDRGVLLGLVGKTGNAKSRVIQPHLHFEIRDRDKPLDPMTILQTQ